MCFKKIMIVYLYIKLLIVEIYESNNYKYIDKTRKTHIVFEIFNCEVEITSITKND